MNTLPQKSHTEIFKGGDYKAPLHQLPSPAYSQKYIASKLAIYITKPKNIELCGTTRNEMITQRCLLIK